MDVRAGGMSHGVANMVYMKTTRVGITAIYYVCIRISLPISPTTHTHKL